MTTLSAILPAFATFALASFDSTLFGVGIAAAALLVSIRQFFTQLDRVNKTAYDPEVGADRAQKFHHRQALRRLQISSLVAIFAALMIVGLYIPAHAHPRAWGVVWIAALGFLLWGGCIALADMISIRLFYSIELDKQHAEELALDYKMKKFQEQNLRDLDEAQQEAERETAEEVKKNESR